MFSWYKYLIVSLVFSHLGFWSGSLFLIAPFPDLCLLVLFYSMLLQTNHTTKYLINAHYMMISLNFTNKREFSVLRAILAVKGVVNRIR